MKELKELEDKADAMVNSLKIINEAYRRINFMLTVIEIKMREDADKNRRIGNALKSKHRDGEIYTVQPQRHDDNSPLVSWACPICGGKIVQVFKKDDNGMIANNQFECECCGTRVAP